MAEKQFQDTDAMVNDPSRGNEYLTTRGVYNEQAAAQAAVLTAMRYSWRYRYGYIDTGDGQ